MTTASLPRPGVQVLQVFRTTSPTVVTPTLVPCVVGVCKQVVSVLTSSGGTGNVLNSDAHVALPAQFLAEAAPGPDYKYSGLGGLDLVFSANNGPDVTATFPASPTALPPSTVVSTINAALAAAGVTSVIAETVGTDQWRLRTLATGEYQTIDISTTTDPTVGTAFGLVPGYHYEGASDYGQVEYDIPPTNLPDPRGNLSQLGVEFDTIRAFLALGSGTDLRELSRTQSFLRRGGGTGATAVLTGTVLLASLSYGVAGDLENTSFVIKIDGTSYTINLGAGEPATSGDLIDAINAEISAVATASNVGGYLEIETLDASSAQSIVMVSGTGTANPLTTLGFTVGQSSNGTDPVYAIADGGGSALTSLLYFLGENFTTAGAAAVVTGSVVLTGLSYPNPVGVANKTLILKTDGKPEQTLLFPTTGIAAAANIVSAINDFFPDLVATLDGSNHLVLTSLALGDEATIEVVGGTAAAGLGLTAALTRGTPFPPKPGDLLYLDGVFYGTITQVAPGGVVQVLKINKKVGVSYGVGQKFFIEAVGLDGSATATRPSSDLIVDLNGNLHLKPEILRDINGTPLLGASAKAGVYLSYRAVRKDVTSSATNASLFRFDSTTQLEATLEPITAENPLGLGAYFALLNAPGFQVTALGVDEISADAPYGTVEGFTRAAEFLEGFEVYAIAPMTHDEVVGQVFHTHVSYMSAPTQRGERIVILNPSMPTRKVNTLVSSGRGNSGSDHATTFDTGAVNLGSLLLAAGVDPTGTIAADSGVFLDIASNDKHYSIESILGSVVTIRTSFGAGENDDGFYSTTDLNDPPLTSSLIDEAFSVSIRGASLTQAGMPDKNAMVETLSAMAQGYSDHRVWHVLPDAVQAPIGGLATRVEGFYACAAIAGLISAQPPQQSFTNFPMTGFNKVYGTTDFFSNRQLDLIAGGGNYILVQDAENAPVIARMALTTDMTSIETRTDSITKVVDFTAKFLRQALKNFIGKFNITQGLLDSLGTALQGLTGYLVEVGILIGADVSQIIQDESAPDSVIIEITLDVPFPCNYIQLTLVILRIG